MKNKVLASVFFIIMLSVTTSISIFVSASPTDPLLLNGSGLYGDAYVTYTPGNTGLSELDVNFTQTDWSNVESVLFRIKNNTITDSPMIFNILESSGEVFVTNQNDELGPNKYSLVGIDDSVTEMGVKWGNVWIPSGFDGTLEIPISSFNNINVVDDGVLDVTNIAKIIISNNVEYNSFEQMFYGDIAIKLTDDSIVNIVDTSSLDAAGFDSTFVLGNNSSHTNLNRVYVDDLGNQEIGAFSYDIDWSTKITGFYPGFNVYELSDEVDYNKAGTYNVSINICDYPFNCMTQTIEVEVRDDLDPTIPEYKNLNDTSLYLGSQLTYDTGGEGFAYTRFMPTITDWTGAEALLIRVRNDVEGGTGSPMAFTIHETSSEQFATNQSDELGPDRVYFIDLDGNITSSGVKWGNVWVPEGFDGTMAIPLSSFNNVGLVNDGVLDLSQIFALYLGVDIQYNSFEIMNFGDIAIQKEDGTVVTIFDVSTFDENFTTNNMILDANSNYTHINRIQMDTIASQEVDVNSSDIDWASHVTGTLPGFTITEKIDNVNYTTLGNYTAQVEVCDIKDNCYTQDVSVDVVDNEDPVFSLVDGLSRSFIVGNTAPDFTSYVTATDNYDGDLLQTNFVVDSSNLDMNIVGNYVVTVTVKDSSNNIATIDLNISVTAEPDVTAPVITQDDTLSVIFDQGSVAPDFKTFVTILDDQDGNISLTDEMIDISNVDMDTVGTFTVAYTVNDNAGNEATLSIDFTIRDTTSPVISEVSNVSHKIEVGDTNYDLTTFITALDNVDGNITLTANMVDASLLDTSILGDYVITYTVKDTAENVSTISITISVVDTTAPTVNGAKNLTVKKGDEINLLENITIADNYDKDLTATIQGSYDLEKAGTYNLAYSVLDSSGNITIENFNLTVEENSSSVITFVIAGLAIAVGGTGFFILKK